jgi:hypothetical protein
VLHAGSQTGAEALGGALLQCDVGLRLVGLALRRAEKDRHHFKVGPIGTDKEPSRPSLSSLSDPLLADLRLSLLSVVRRPC